MRQRGKFVDLSPPNPYRLNGCSGACDGLVKDRRSAATDVFGTNPHFPHGETRRGMQVPAIELRQLVKCYGKRRALDDLTVTVASGGVVGFLGVNGAGKSTTMRILAGYLAPTSGTATVCGIDVAADSLAVRECVGYLPENNPLYPEMRVTEYLRFRARLKGVSRGARAGAVERVVRSCRLDDASGRLIGQLSKGYRQRVGLADCLLTEAPLLILDEPMAGLDPNQARQTRQLIAEIGRTRTVFLSTHALGDVESICREAVSLPHGR